MKNLRESPLWLGLSLLACATSPQSASDRPTTLQDLQSRVAAKPDDSQALLELGLLYEKLGDRARARQYVERARENGADENRALIALVRLSLALDDYSSAAGFAETLEGVLSRSPRDHERTLVEVRTLLGEIRRALEGQL